MWDLVPWPGMEPWRLALGAWSLSHWAAKEVHFFIDFLKICTPQSSSPDQSESCTESSLGIPSIGVKISRPVKNSSTNTNSHTHTKCLGVYTAPLARVPLPPSTHPLPGDAFTLSVWLMEAGYTEIFLELTGFCSPFNRTLPVIWHLEQNPCIFPSTNIYWPQWPSDWTQEMKALSVWSSRDFQLPSQSPRVWWGYPQSFNDSMSGTWWILLVVAGFTVSSGKIFFFLASASWMWLENHWWEFKRVFF